GEQRRGAVDDPHVSVPLVDRDAGDLADDELHAILFGQRLRPGGIDTKARRLRRVRRWVLRTGGDERRHGDDKRSHAGHPPLPAIYRDLLTADLLAWPRRAR